MAIGEVPVVTVLSVSPNPEDHLALERILTESWWETLPNSFWQVSRATTVSSALTTLREVQCPVILCDRDLPFGNWKDLLHYSNRLANPPLVIVTSLHADEYLWAEALNLGAHDVLSKPFYPPEVIRVVTLASLRWCNRQPAAPKARFKPSASAA